MKPLKRVLKQLLLTATVATVGISIPASALSILLTNDDGYQTANIRALYKALVEAGHSVTVSAPRENQSGKSSSLNFRGRMDAGVDTEQPDIHYLDGTPVMATLYGLDILLDAAPDLVISGPNEGQNLGVMTSYSGTVGAAVLATSRGIPAIAVSADADADGSPPELIAKFVVRLVAEVKKNSIGGALLPPGVGLNVNLPTLLDEAGKTAVAGIKFTRVGTFSGYQLQYVKEMGPYIASYPSSYFASEQDPSGEQTRAAMARSAGLAVTPQSPEIEQDPLAEGLWMQQGYITVSVMNGSYGSGYSQNLASALLKQLSY